MPHIVHGLARGRLNLGKFGVTEGRVYQAEVDENGIITLTPSVVLSEAEVKRMRSSVDEGGDPRDDQTPSKTRGSGKPSAPALRGPAADGLPERSLPSADSPS